MLDWLLLIALGFLGSFGHCLGMCGPLAVAFSLSCSHLFRFHLLLNLGRIFSYALVGGLLGAISSVLVASGQLLGIGSLFRQVMAIFTGLILIWFGLRQIKPHWLPNLPFLHPLEKAWHNQLSSKMIQLSLKRSWWTPTLLGAIWGLIPCGFLYVAQLKAIATGSFWLGAGTMLGFGLGTMPMMLGIGISTAKLSEDQRSQLFRLGGWVTLGIGILTLLRTDKMFDYTGHGALFLLMLALIARPVSGFWSAPLRFRRALGVGCFVLALAHTAHMLDHSLNWNLGAIAFMLNQHQWGMRAGILALLLLLPAAVTSFDGAQKALGKWWRQIHLLSVPALILAIIHTVLLGSHYLGALQLTIQNRWRVVIVILLGIIILVLRSGLFSFSSKRKQI